MVLEMVIATLRETAKNRLEKALRESVVLVSLRCKFEEFQTQGTRDEALQELVQVVRSAIENARLEHSLIRLSDDEVRSVVQAVLQPRAAGAPGAANAGGDGGFGDGDGDGDGDSGDGGDVQPLDHIDGSDDGDLGDGGNGGDDSEDGDDGGDSDDGDDG